MPCFRIVAAFALFLCTFASAGCAQAQTEDQALHDRVMRVLATAPLVDGHNDLLIHYHACGEGCPRGVEGYDLSGNAPGHTDIARWRRGGVGAQLLNAEFTDGEAPTLEGTLQGLAFVRALVDRYPRDLVMARTAEDVRRASQAGRIAIVLALENPGRLGSDQATVQRLGAEGVRSAILGQDMVGWMEEAGILVDLSHASAETMRDVLDVARAPVLFSHSNAAALADMPRNVPDDVLRRLPQNGGVVMVGFVPYFATNEFAEWMAAGDAYWESLLAEHAGDRTAAQPAMQQWEREHSMPTVGVAAIADHIEHIRDVAGIDHVGIGSDFDGIAFTVSGLEDVAGYPRLFEELARRGWSDEDLAKLAGGNVLRVLGAADVRVSPEAERQFPPVSVAPNTPALPPRPTRPAPACA